MFENDLNIGRIWLFSVGEEVNELNEKSMDQLLRRVRSISSNGKNNRQNFIQKDGKHIFFDSAFEHFFNDIGNDRVHELTGYNFDLISAVDGQPTGSAQNSGQIETVVIVEDVDLN